jgi:YegS/Rv2252/BmrU family lipid kinase
LIIANPASGAANFQNHSVHLNETLKILRDHGWRVDLVFTSAPGDARKFARQAVAQKADLVIAAGGDGTINEIIQELAGTETALGVLPNGTVNVWAREMGIPLNEVGARDVLLNGQIRQVDLGLINGRYFLLMVGVGFDGEVTHAIEKRPIKRLGVLAYLVVAIARGFGYPSFPVSLEMNERVVKTHALQIVIGNTQLYGGAMKLTWEAKCDDGLLDVCLVSNRNVFGRFATLMDFLLHREQRRLRVRYYTSTSIKVETQEPVAMQIDGEPGGFTPATCVVVPDALKVLVPQQLPEGLFVEIEK